MPVLDSGAERLSPALPRRYVHGCGLIAAMAALAAASLSISVKPGVLILDDHAVQFSGEEAITCNAGNTLSASSEVYTDLVAYWNPATSTAHVIAVDGDEALTSAGAEAPTDAEVVAALPSEDCAWIRLGRVKFSRSAGTAITIEEIDHTVRPFEITTGPKATGQASSSNDVDPIGSAALYEYAGELAFEVDAADLAAADVVTDYPLPLFHGKIGRTRALVTKAITTGAKAADLDFEIGAAAITGGQIALAGAYALGAVEAGAAITADAEFIPGDTLSVVGSAVTPFIEGRVKIVAELYRLVV